MTSPPLVRGPLPPSLAALLVTLLILAAPVLAGTLVNARCPCGYHTERMPLFGGRANFRTVCLFPALCPTSHELVLVNLLDPLADIPQCPGGKTIPYTDPSLALTVGGPVVTSWNVRDRGLSVQLFSHGYRCPRCGRPTLSFSFAGNWD